MQRPPTSQPGSSPRLRGTTFTQSPNMAMAPVHPRACGEHRGNCHDPLRRPGSSPRLRGTHRIGCPPSVRPRFIPAPAGNTRGRNAQATWPPVHPRACGEHWNSAHSKGSPIGSSPRLRGTPKPPARHLHRDRFIPAPAGNTPPPETAHAGRSVHPRACGEHSGAGHRRPRSPHARPRFIPAPAGNTCQSIGSSAPPSVHPRACGEHCSKNVSGVRFGGSSPRLRGTPRRFACRRIDRRFIPAPAGNTRHGSRIAAARRAVHPRACGEHFTMMPNGWHSFGSSPRLRGTLRCGAGHQPLL